MSSHHPPALVPLCLIEAAERFAASLLAALLVLHLTDGLKFRPGLATVVQAVFMGLTYGLSILGGLLVDRHVGYRRALTLGLLLLGGGYTLLSLTGSFALVGGLGLLILGQALFKPTMAAVLGALYQSAPAMRTAGFAWFYVSINIAAFIAPWVGALLREKASWSRAMTVAAWSVALGLAVLFCVVARLPEPVLPQSSSKPDAATASHTAPVRVPWSRLARLLIVMLSFSIAYSQSQGTLLLFARDHLVRTVERYELPTEAFAALPALLVLMLKPGLDILRQASAARGLELHGKRQLILGLLLTSCAFLFLSGATSSSPISKLSPVWLLGAEMLLTAAELCVVPETMALTAELSPHKNGALSQGVLFGAQALAFLIGGLVSSLWGQLPETWFFALVAATPLIGIGVLAVSGRWIGQ